MQVRQIISSDHYEDREPVLRVPATAVVLPRPIYEGQDYTKFSRGLKEAYEPDQTGTGWSTPEVELNLYRLREGRFFVGDGLDGVIMTAEGDIISETSAFASSLDVLNTNKIPDEVFDLGTVFIGFDAAWRNYFHWLCFAIAKSEFAMSLIGASARICLPDYRSAAMHGGMSFSETTYNQSIEYAGLGDRLLRLPKGVYRAKELLFLWTRPHRPTDYLHLPVFQQTFDRMVARVAPEKCDPLKVHLTRSSAVHTRVEEATSRLLDDALQRKGFRTIDFATLTLSEQIGIMHNADRLVSPHGAGMSNCLFGQRHLNVLELNRDLDSNGSLRPWFYLLCSGRGQAYSWLDVEELGDARSNLEQALREMKL